MTLNILTANRNTGLIRIPGWIDIFIFILSLTDGDISNICKWLSRKDILKEQEFVEYRNHFLFCLKLDENTSRLVLWNHQLCRSSINYESLTRLRNSIIYFYFYFVLILFFRLKKVQRCYMIGIVTKKDNTWSSTYKTKYFSTYEKQNSKILHRKNNFT